jgi:hypothetical protein
VTDPLRRLAESAQRLLPGIPSSFAEEPEG